MAKKKQGRPRKNHPGFETDLKSKTADIDLLSEEPKIEAAYRKNSEKHFMHFARGLTIASQHGPKLFENCMAPYQRQCFESIAGSVEQLREGAMPDFRRFWIERTKKAAKDSDLAVFMLWLLCFPTRPFYGQVGAATKEQAKIVKDRMTHLLHWNPWLNQHVEIVQWEVRSKARMADGSPLAKLDIMSSDVAGAHGGTPDLLVINELSHMTRWEFAENLMDNADGVAQGMVIIATNAGFKGTKAEVWRNNAIAHQEEDGSFNWKVFIWPRPAPWHTPEVVEDARRRNTRSRYMRLWQGKWASGKGDALDERDINKCFTMKGPITEPEPGWIYIAGLDLGVHHDHSGLVVLGINISMRRLKLAKWLRWKPSKAKNDEVDLMDVERQCRKLDGLFRFVKLLYDPSQAKLMAQRLQQTIPMVEYTFSSPKNLTDMAVSLIQVIESKKLDCYDDEDGTLRHDFGKLNIVEKPYGYKLEAVSDEFGHADVATALVICLPEAVRCLDGWMGFGIDDTLVIDDGGEEITEKDVEDLPDALKEIYDMEDEIEEDFDEFI